MCPNFRKRPSFCFYDVKILVIQSKIEGLTQNLVLERQNLPKILVFISKFAKILIFMSKFVQILRLAQNFGSSNVKNC